MKIIVGDYDENTRQVSARFEHGGIVHERFVNACLDEDGAYDEEATAARCDEVSRGVKIKIEAGLFRPEPAPESVQAAEDAIIDKMVGSAGAKEGTDG